MLIKNKRECDVKEKCPRLRVHLNEMRFDNKIENCD